MNGNTDKMEEKWDIVVTPERKWYELNLKETHKYRDLTWLFVKRSFNAQYKQTILGPLWFIINPLITTLISTLVFGNIAGIGSDGVPYFLFYLVGYTLWNYFSTCVSTTSTTFTANAAIMGKVYFPRLTMPISAVIFAAVNMLVIFGMSIIAIIVYSFMGVEININIYMLFIPILMIQTAVIGLGVLFIYKQIRIRRNKNKF